MKEATGELNMTVVTVVAIAAVAAFFYAFVWPTVRQNITNATRCANAICMTCDDPKTTTGKVKCTGCTDAANPDSEDKFTCQYANAEAAEKAGNGGYINLDFLRK